MGEYLCVIKYKESLKSSHFVEEIDVPHVSCMVSTFYCLMGIVFLGEGPLLRKMWLVIALPQCTVVAL